MLGLVQREQIKAEENQCKSCKIHSLQNYCLKFEEQNAKNNKLFFILEQLGIRAQTTRVYRADTQRTLSRRCLSLA